MNYNLVDKNKIRADVMCNSPLTIHHAIDLTIEAMLEASPPVKVETVVIDEPNYNSLSMEGGLEDRNITDRYEAMAYGWDCAIERLFEQIPEGTLYTSPPNLEAKLTTLLTAVENYIAPANSFLEVEDRLQELKRLHAEFTK